MKVAHRKCCDQRPPVKEMLWTLKPFPYAAFIVCCEVCGRMQIGERFRDLKYLMHVYPEEGDCFPMRLVD